MKQRLLLKDLEVEDSHSQRNKLKDLEKMEVSPLPVDKQSKPSDNSNGAKTTNIK